MTHDSVMPDHDLDIRGGMHDQIFVAVLLQGLEELGVDIVRGRGEALVGLAEQEADSSGLFGRHVFDGVHVALYGRGLDTHCLYSFFFR